MHKAHLLPCVLLLSALGACSSPAIDWSKALATNTLAGYGAFLAKYPGDPRASDAARHIDALEDAAAWNRAQVASSMEGYQQYLRQWPAGAHADLAKQNIISRERARAWSALQSNLTPEAIEAFLKQYPPGPETDEATAKLRELAGYRAELSSATSQHGADLARTRLAHTLKSWLPALTVLAPDSKDDSYRVVSVPMSESDAINICGRVSALGRTCQVVPSGLASARG